MEEYLQYIGNVVGAAALTGAAAMATSLYMSTLPAPMTPNIDLGSQSKQLPGPERIRCSKFYPDGKLLEYIYDDARTLHDIFYRGARKSDNGPCLGWRAGKNGPYKFLSYSEVIQRIKNFASGLVRSGMVPGQSTFVGIYSQNCPEWVITEQACYYHSSIIVPLYDTLGPNACSYIINQADIEIVVCDKENKVVAILKESINTPKLKTIISMQKVSEDVKRQAEGAGVSILLFKDVEALGEQHVCTPMSPRPSDISTVCYTSGTTGNPKGVMLTHGNVITACSAYLLQFGVHGPKPTDIMISYLPLAHVLERCVQILLFVSGGSVGFFQGDVRLLTDDIKALKPTFIPMVPRLLNRIYDQIQNNVSGSRMKKWLMDMALMSKQAELERHIITNRSVWDKFVFKPAQESLGGRVRVIVTGSAPLAANVLTFLRCALGCAIVEGYAQTESAAGGTMTMVGDYSVGHVGPPVPCCHIKLIDVPEMQYYSVNGEGEVCMKGSHIFKGYLKEPEKTAETIDEDGWLHTGDIGKWLDNGTLRIIDRKKNIFKLAQGEYIAPEKIENIYLSSQYISQIFVHGESLKSCLVAIVVPEKSMVLNWCQSNDISGDWEEICKNKELKKMLLDDIIAIGKKAGLKSFEQVKDIYVSHTLLSVDNGLLTPTLKTKRNECKKFFMPQIEAMYSCLT